MNAVEAEGTTLEEAIANALRQLQVERDRVEIEVLAQPTKGFLGIGGKKARVRAALRVPLSARAGEPRTDTTRPAPRAAEQKAEAPQPQALRREATSETGPRPHTPLSPEITEKACSTLKELLGFMGTASTLNVETRGDETVINVTHVADLPEGFLIGHRGQTLDALEYLVNRIVTKSDEIDAHVAIDVEGYRERRWKVWKPGAAARGTR